MIWKIWAGAGDVPINTTPMALRKSVNSDETIVSPKSLSASRVSGVALPMGAGAGAGGRHPTKRLGPANARPAKPFVQPDGMDVVAPVAWTMRKMLAPVEAWKIALSVGSHAIPAHVEFAGPLRRNVVVPSGMGVPPIGGLLLKMLMSIA